jgi:sulfur carrier protein
LALLELGNRRVAVAVNRNVVARSHYATTKLSDGDRVEILGAVGGG